MTKNVDYLKTNIAVLRIDERYSSEKSFVLLEIALKEIDRLERELRYATDEKCNCGCCY